MISLGAKYPLAMFRDGFSPLAVKLRPKTLDSLIGQEHLLGVGSVLRSIATAPTTSDSQNLSSVILWGPPGTGKTTIALAVAKSSGRTFIEINAVTAGVKDVKDAVTAARKERSDYGRETIVFIDEIHRFNRAQQDALLGEVENGTFLLIAATTENPSVSINGPLLSRCVLLELKPLSEGELNRVLENALSSPDGFNSSLEFSAEAKLELVRLSSGDARRVLVLLETVSNYAVANSITKIQLDDVKSMAGSALLHYDKNGDTHYDVISAYIKSVRGSDVDAAVHYLARMLESGEDPKFISRRLMILAAEDVGLADPQALVIATSAAQSVSLIGMPEGRIALAEATIYLALAPKSNSAYLAINAAIQDVRDGKSGQVPNHLRSSHPAQLTKLKYRYPHDDVNGVVAQTYMPESLVGSSYYEPKLFGLEEVLAKRWKMLIKLIRGH